MLLQMNFNSIAITQKQKLKHLNKNKYMKIEFQNSIERLSFLHHITTLELFV